MIEQLLRTVMKAAGWVPVKATDSHVTFKNPASGNEVTIPTDPSDPDFQTLMGTAFNKFLAANTSKPVPPEPKDEPKPETDAIWPKVGDWVLVWGQVASGLTHRDDMIVEFHSHSDQWQGHVRKDRTVTPTQNPPFTDRCTAMFAHPRSEDAYVRCTLHDRHGDIHHTAVGLFADDQIVGHFDDDV